METEGDRDRGGDIKEVRKKWGVAASAIGGGHFPSTEDPSWRYPVPGLGAVSPFLEPIRCDFFQKLTDLVKIDFEIPPRRALREATPGRTCEVASFGRSDGKRVSI